ncbi:hypothetical protein EPO04_03680 [Patescibacteria group bacterium]|nr:MAG: hypothetical protein EPO04_03680 [Patescibacteria group bacterium]
MQRVRDQLRKLHVGTIIGVIVALYIGVYLVQTIQKNYELQKQIDGLQQDVAGLEVEQDQLKYKIQYYQTEAFKEKEAREKLGLQQPGESVLILPKDNAPAEDEQQQKPAATQKSNLQQWIDFLMGRS